jgi:MFS transporter, ACS family, hexuronate transporter
MDEQLKPSFGVDASGYPLPPVSSPGGPGGKPRTRVRWTVCALVFFAATISYLDRQVLSFLAKTLETSIGWNNIEYGYITAAFQASYAVGLLGVGRLMDRVGVRKGFALAVGLWSVAAVSHAAARTALAFGVARAALGLGESATFPASMKTLAEWFPKRERALATGFFNSGTNIGAIAVPLLVPWLARAWGWQAAFLATGLSGFVWVAAWWFMYRAPSEHPGVSPSELAHIQSDPPDAVESVPWRALLPLRGTWQFGIGKFLTDPSWWFFIFWLPKYLQEAFHLSMQQIILPTLVVFNLSSIGSVAGGWLSSALIKRGWTVYAARRAALLTAALCVAPVVYAPFAGNLWAVVFIMGFGMAAHQAWSANLYTLAADGVPKVAVGSVVGIGAAMGAASGVLIQIITGYVVQLTHSYVPLFLFCGVTYIVTLGIMSLLGPKTERA